MIDGNFLLGEFIKILPNCGLIFLIVTIAYIFRNPLSDLFTHLTHIGAFGVEMDFGEVKEELRSAILTYRKDLFGNLPKDEAVDDAKLEWLLRRAEKIKALLHGARILWVDDQPLANAAIFRFLNDYGVFIDYARDTNEALSAIKWSSNAYEVVVTDMVRAGDEDAGLDLLAGIKELEKDKDPAGWVKVLLFVYAPDPSKGTPAGAEIITNKVDKLLEEIFDIIELKNQKRSKEKDETR
jgi:CheY-like chemotaxis protein